MKYHWLLDNGHGGIIDGVYTTAPSKMYKFEDGTTIYEGDFNRRVVNKIVKKLSEKGVNYTILVPELEDISLSTRVKRADAHYAIDKSCIFVSVHGNAGKGTGFEVFTSVGQTRSDKIAEVFFGKMEKAFPKKAGRKDNSDGDSDKEAQFYLLRKTDCPAILTENFFMDRLEDAKLMLSDEGQEKIANAHVEAILEIESKGGF
jgi:N-acetylmuramoyl-L-alanine amidase